MSIPYIYKIKNIHTGKYYIGAQYGKNSNPQNFWKTYFTSSKCVKENLKEFKIIYVRPRKDAREYESKLLSRLYSFYGKDNFCEMMINRNLAPGILIDKDERKRISARLKERWKNGGMAAAHEKAKVTRKSRVYNKVILTEEKRKQISERMKSNNPMFREEIRKKHLESVNSIECLRKKSESKKGNKNCKNKHWFNNGIESRMFFECPQGWSKGRLNPHWNYNRKAKP